MGTETRDHVKLFQCIRTLVAHALATLQRIPTEHRVQTTSRGGYVRRATAAAEAPRAEEGSKVHAALPNQTRAALTRIQTMRAGQLFATSRAYQIQLRQRGAKCAPDEVCGMIRKIMTHPGVSWR